MTFDSAPSAIDGALLSSAIIRRGNFAFSSGAEGVVLKTDLAVTQLGTPGVGILIAAGVGLVLNKYQATPNETYVVSNPNTHTVAAIDMPASNPSPQSYLVAVVVGDKAFSQGAHPWMLATDPPAGTETTFQYVRPTLIPCSAGATTISAAYPALVLARIDIPASTTTITNAMITDLRALARPRQEQQIFCSPNGTWNNTTPAKIPSGSAYADWGTYSPSVVVPSWAKRCVVVASVNGVALVDASVNVTGGVQMKLGSLTGPATAFDYSLGGGAVRQNLACAGAFDVSSVAGTSQALKIQGFENVPASPTTNQKMDLRAGSQIIFDVRFFEQ